MKSHSVGAYFFPCGWTDGGTWRDCTSSQFFYQLSTKVDWLHMRFGRGSERKRDPIIHLIANWIDFILARYIVYRKKCTFLTVFFLSFLLWPLLPTHCRCRGLLSYVITLRHTTVGRTHLDEGSARRRDLYRTTHNIHKRHPRPWRDSKPQSQEASGRRSTP